ncbi:Zinc finger protein 234 [Araneus ventricosus]|uniref:Zinc finger protein 234 n=1 Tax=Araneus ventricosus TaxID=182803 RepID=A0A4Y2VEG0_ARAVE|nr:Zinc finger protein 234 [Araneus ventricosus]
MDEDVAYICDVCKDNSSLIQDQSKNYCRVSSLQSSFECTECPRSVSMGYEAIGRQSLSACSYARQSSIAGTCDREECGECFRIESQLRNSIPNETFLKCNICHLIFKYRSAFRAHMKRHGAPKPFRCKLCNKRYEYKQLLERHMVTHSKSRTHKCDICTSAFEKNRKLNTHIKQHDDLKLFACELCNMSWESEQRFQSHFKTLSHKITALRPSNI